MKNWDTSSAVEKLRKFPASSLNPQLVCLLAAVALFYPATIRPGHVWDDDFAMYVHRAQNIVDGRPYADTGYLFNPHAPVVGPRMYPPVFQPTLQTVGANFISYPRALAGCWVASTRNAFSFFVLGIVAVLTLAGVFFQSKRGLTIVEALVTPYTAMVILWPFFHGARLVFPPLP